MALPTQTNRAAIRAAISEVMRGLLGTNRRLDQGVFYRGRFSTKTRDQKQALARSIDGVARHLFELSIGQTPIVDNGATAVSASSSQRIANVPVTIRTLTAVSEECDCEVVFGEPPREATVEAQDDAIDQLLSDLEDAVQALGAPNNLLATSAGRDTDIVSGVMSDPATPLRGTPQFRITREDWEMQILESQIDGIVVVTIPANT